MSSTPNLSLPYIASGQAQKHVTHNEALKTIDALVHLTAKSRVLMAPPASPADGERYLIPSGATGLWSGQSARIAAFQDGGWVFYTPRSGWIVWIESEALLLAWTGTQWSPAAGVIDGASRIGLNTSANSNNRLAVASNGILLTHAGASHRATINKAAPADTASIVLQTNFSGRAEIGLAGDDALRIKTSADGTTWKTALAIDPASGVSTFNDKFQLAQRAAISAFGVPTVRSSTAGQVTAFDIMPNGTVTDAGSGFAWLDICDTDVFASNSPTGTLHLAAKATDMEIGVRGVSGGALKPMTLTMGGVTYGTLAVDGTWTFGPGKVTFKGNAAPLPATTAGTQLHIGGADNTNALCYFDAYGTGVPAFLSRRARGTGAAPSAVQASDLLFVLGGFGYGATGYSNVGRAQVIMSASEAWTDTAQGAQVAFVTTANGTAAQTQRFVIEPAGHARPAADNTYSLGTASFRWSSVFAANGVIQTSDARDKTVLGGLSGFAGNMVDAVDPVLFQWRTGGQDCIAEADDDTSDALATDAATLAPRPGKRAHAGFLAQDIKAAMDAEGIDFAAWGLDDVEDAGSRQWTRPDQLVAVLWAALRETRAEVKRLSS